MSTVWLPCAKCARHVKQGDCACPFCGEGLACATRVTGGASGTNASMARLSRAALVAASAVGVVLSVTGCAASSTPVYGGPVPPLDADAGDDARPTLEPGPTLAPEGGSNDTTSKEGGAAPDGGTEASSPRPLPIPVYGGPPPPIDSPDIPGPGGRSEPVDRREGDPAAVVPPRRRRRQRRATDA